MYLMKLSAACKQYLWGGQNLKQYFGTKNARDSLAEAWVVSAHENGMSKIENGGLSGMDFADAVKDTKLLGTKSTGGSFPVLIKLIDAEQNLSIQVHPDDVYANKRHGCPGKTEMWYILDCKPGAYIYYGFNKKVSRVEFLKSIENGNIIELLNKVYVNKGDCFFIEAGTVHAICAGILLAEVQQNSDKTYRIYDYNRKDSDGKPRETHIEEAVQVSILDIPKHPVIKPNILEEEIRLASCEYFTVKYMRGDNFKINVGKESFAAVLILEGESKIEYEGGSVNYKKYDSFFAPAGLGELIFKGECRVLLTTL